VPALPRRWWLKAAAQGAVSLLPVAQRLDDRLRRLRTGTYLEPEYFLSKWHHVAAHTRVATGAVEGDLSGSRVLELGTGWFPIVPLGLALRGAEVLTIDTAYHLDPARVRLTLRVLDELATQDRIEVGDPGRLEQLRRVLHVEDGAGMIEELGRLGVRAVVADARDLSDQPAAHGADLMVSNNTLEHIPSEVLRGIFAEFGRIASAAARMSHYVDLADHYAGFDPSLGEFHFLTLSPTRWRLANNRLHYQNRLRIGDYRRLHEESGWQVTRERPTRRDRSDLDGLQLVPPFDGMPVEDLLVVKAHLAAERA
jgi:hypothetical protein